jgi:AcrR family transcriptional regulator
MVSDERLMRAAVDVFATRGYRDARVEDILQAAGVSRETFYVRYRSKEHCFAVVQKSALQYALAAIVPADDAPWPVAGELEAPIAAVLAMIAADPALARVIFVESLSAGARPRARLEQVKDGLADLLARSYGVTGEPDVLANGVLHGVVGGLDAIVAARIRTGRTAELPALAPQLAAWVAAYQALLAAPRPALPAPAWPVPPGGRAPGTLGGGDARSRLLDAVVQVCADDGFDAFTVGAAVARARTSRRAFYQQFDSPARAFTSALDAGMEAAYDEVSGAFEREPEWDRAALAGVGTFVRFLAAEPAFARTAFVVVPEAGPEAVKGRDAGRGRFATRLGGVLRGAPRPRGCTPELASEAFVGGSSALYARAIKADGAGSVMRLLPVVGLLLLVPFIGPAAAEEAVRSWLAGAVDPLATR